MEPKTSYNFDFLNNYFTTKEFDFINHANLESQKLDEIINKETETRDVIVNFINNLNDSINNMENSKSNPEFLQLLSEVQDIFEKINDNIKMVHELKLAYSEISDNIVELLIKIESNPDNKKIYIDEIQKLKDMINEFATQNEEIKSKVLLNDIKIDTFFQKNIVKKYLSSFDIELNLSTVSESLNKPSNDEHVVNSKVINIKDTKTSVISEDLEENNTLLVSEKAKKVFLPYTKSEISLYLEQYPDDYKSPRDVIKKEFVLSLDYYMKHPVLARFREAYSLIRDRESKSVLDAFKFAIDIMFHYELSPVIIAACKTQEQLENYMSCLERNKLDEFTDFEIKFEVNPLA